MTSIADTARRWGRACIVGTVLILPVAGLAQTADEIIEKHIEAIGGKAALDRVEDRVETWSVALHAMGVASEGTLVLKAKRPDKLTQKYEIDYEGQVIKALHGYDGKTGWEENQGFSSPVEGEELVELRNYTLRTNGWELLWAKGVGAIVGFRGKEEMEGKPVFVLEVTPEDGRKITYFLDAETYLIWKIDWKTMQQGMVIDFDARFTSYRQVDGIQVPDEKVVVNSIEEMGVEINYKMTLEEVAFNTGLKDSDFSSPFGGSPGRKPSEEKKKGWY